MEGDARSVPSVRVELHIRQGERQRGVRVQDEKEGRENAFQEDGDSVRGASEVQRRERARGGFDSGGKMV